MSEKHFYSSAEHTLDDKNRFIMPVQFRAGLGEKFFICKGMNDKCVWIMPESEFHATLDRMKEAIPKSDRRGQKWIALFTESAIDRSLDRHNRVTIPQHLLDYAEINARIKVYGHAERVEVWALDRWHEIMDVDFSELSEDMCKQYNI